MQNPAETVKECEDNIFLSQLWIINKHFTNLDLSRKIIYNELYMLNYKDAKPKDSRR